MLTKFKLGFLLIFILLISSYNYLYTHDIEQIDFNLILQGISIDHPLGTDILGRDMLSRLLLASFFSLAIVITIVILSASLGSFIGILYNLCHKFYKNLILAICDILLSIPFNLLSIVIIALFSTSTLSLILSLSIINSIKYLRLTINLSASVYVKPYVLEARHNGINEISIALKLVLPNISLKLLITMCLDVAEILILVSAFSFLGIGTNYNTPNLGTLLFEGKSYFQGASHLLLGPGLFLFAIVLCFNLIADYLSKYLNSKDPL